MKANLTSLASQFNIDLRKDFFCLGREEVSRVLEAADVAKYRKPKQANGSRARYFFARLQRNAK